MFNFNNNLASKELKKEPIYSIKLHTTHNTFERESWLPKESGPLFSKKNFEDLRTVIESISIRDIAESIMNLNSDLIIENFKCALAVLLDFLLVDGNASAFGMTILFGLVANKFFILCRRMLSHERSKKLYFYFYSFSMGFILAQCFFLVTSLPSHTADEGLLLLYIYVTATIMLFLIFLALTTCESYLFKGRDINNLPTSVSLVHMIYSTLVFLLALNYFDTIMTEVYNLSSSKGLSFYSFSTNTHHEMMNRSRDWTFKEKYNAFNGIRETKTSWSIFDKLKFDVIDNYTNYMLSAVLQTCALILVILSLVM